MSASPSHSHRSALVLTTPALAQNAQSIQQQPTSPKLGGRDSWTARWQKRTRREAFDCDDWFGSGIRRGPQSGCGQGSLIAGKQERSSSQVTLQLSPDLEIVGRLRPAGRGPGGKSIRLGRSAVTPPRSAMLKASCGWWKLPAAADLIARFWHLRPARVPRDGLARGLTSGPAATARPSADARTIEPIGRSRSASLLELVNTLMP